MPSAWSPIVELTVSPWSVAPELSPSFWSTLQELPETTTAFLKGEGQLSTTLGFILRSLSGDYYRLGVDNDGDVLSTGLGVAYSGAEPLFTRPGSGIIVHLDDGLYGRMTVNGDGVPTAEPVLLSSWSVFADSVGSLDRDVLIVGDGTGIICVTPDGLHTYRVRLEVDGAYSSERIS